MINASVDLEPGTLEPTYRVTLGLPGRSYALTIADRLGLTPEIVETARSLVSPSLRAADDLIQELQEERVVVAQLRQESEELAAQARTQQAEVEARLASVESARLELVEEARQDLQNRIGDLLSQLQQAERALQLAEEERATHRLLRPAGTSPGEDGSESLAAALQEQQAQLTEAQRAVSAAQWQPIEVKRTPWQERLRSGDRVYIRGIPRPVEVITPQDSAEQVEVLLGTMRARIPVYQLERPAESGIGPASESAGIAAGRATGGAAVGAGGSTPGANSPGSPDATNSGVRFRHNRDAGVYYRRPSPRQVKTELDLRGQRVDAALEQVENLLNQAALSGAAELRIIHGRGTGALRRAVREYLQGHPLVASAGSSGDGSNDGVTVVELK
jgi:DNA mismatch repair protein MutS2